MRRGEKQKYHKSIDKTVKNRRKKETQKGKRKKSAGMAKKKDPKSYANEFTDVIPAGATHECYKPRRECAVECTASETLAGRSQSQANARREWLRFGAHSTFIFSRF